MEQLQSVAWVLQQQGKVLLVKNRGKDKFFIPGGKLEAAESPEQALAREVAEELNVSLEKATIEPLFTIVDRAYGLKDTQLSMHCFSAQYQGEISCNAEIECLEWFDLSALERCAPAAQQVLRRLL